MTLFLKASLLYCIKCLILSQYWSFAGRLSSSVLETLTQSFWILPVFSVSSCNHDVLGDGEIRSTYGAYQLFQNLTRF